MMRRKHWITRRLATRVGVVGVAVAALVAPATADVATVTVRPLPPDRLGTVVAWQTKSNTAVVALNSGRLMTIHSLRKQKPGTRVRISGIKWGTPTSGIKWARTVSGIKWGIKWARNGTYQSNLRPISQAKRVRIRGVVVKRYPGAVAIGTKGGVVVVRQAVWLPRKGKTTKTTKALEAKAVLIRPAVGDLVTTNARVVGPNGRLYGDGVRVIPTAEPIPVPTGGELKRGATANTIRVTAMTDPAYTVTTTMKVPGGVDVSKIKPGTEVAATATVNKDASLRVAELSPNTSFEAANDPSQQIVVPPPAPAASMGLIDEAIRRWDQAIAENKIPDATLAANGRTLLQQARVAAADGQWESAATALDQYQQLVESAYGTGADAAVVASQISLVSVILQRIGS